MVGLIRGVSEGLGPVGGAAAIYSLSGLLLIFTVGFPLKRRTKNAKTFHDKCENFNFRASNETAALTAVFLFITWGHFGYG